MNLSSDNNIEESDFSLRKFSLLSQNARNENPGGFLELKVKMQKINRPLNVVLIDLLLLSIDNRQGVTSMLFKTNEIQIAKNEIRQLSIQNSQKGRFRAFINRKTMGTAFAQASAVEGRGFWGEQENPPAPFYGKRGNRFNHHLKTF